MTSEFNVHNAAGYEQLMGRWSRRLARQFIDFTEVSDGQKDSRRRLRYREHDLRAR